MRNKLPIFPVVVALAAMSSSAHAAPMCWGNLAGSTYVVSCSNLEQATYDCLATFDVVNGSQKQHYDSSFDVKAASGGRALAVPSPFSGMNVQGKNFAYSCNMLARSSTGNTSSGQSSSSDAAKSGASKEGSTSSGQ